MQSRAEELMSHLQRDRGAESWCNVELEIEADGRRYCEPNKDDTGCGRLLLDQREVVACRWLQTESFT
jgi:hypothetical protein